MDLTRGLSFEPGISYMEDRLPGRVRRLGWKHGGRWLRRNGCPLLSGCLVQGRLRYRAQDGSRRYQSLDLDLQSLETRLHLWCQLQWTHFQSLIFLASRHDKHGHTGDG